MEDKKKEKVSPEGAIYSIIFLIIIGLFVWIEFYSPYDISDLWNKVNEVEENNTNTTSTENDSSISNIISNILG